MARRQGLVVFPGGQVVTKNGTGMQMSAEGPLFERWVEAWRKDGPPIADVGCAFGLHTLAAARRGAAVVAVDCEQEHLEVVDRVAHGEGLGPLVTVVHGTLPLGLGLPPGSQAAILCAEVLQFLLPHQVPPALSAMLDALVPGGLLLLTSPSIYAYGGAMVPVLEVKSRQGVNGPCVVDKEDLDMRHALAAALEAHGVLRSYEAVVAAVKTFPRQYFMRAKELSGLVAAAGFEVVTASYASNPGYVPWVQHCCGLDNVQVVGRKPLARSHGTPGPAALGV